MKRKIKRKRDEDISPNDGEMMIYGCVYDGLGNPRSIAIPTPSGCLYVTYRKKEGFSFETSHFSVDHINRHWKGFFRFSFSGDQMFNEAYRWLLKEKKK